MKLGAAFSYRNYMAKVWHKGTTESYFSAIDVNTELQKKNSKQPKRIIQRILATERSLTTSFRTSGRLTVLSSTAIAMTLFNGITKSLVKVVHM